MLQKTKQKAEILVLALVERRDFDGSPPAAVCHDDPLANEEHRVDAFGLERPIREEGTFSNASFANKIFSTS